MRNMHQIQQKPRLYGHCEDIRKTFHGINKIQGIRVTKKFFWTVEKQMELFLYNWKAWEWLDKTSVVKQRFYCVAAAAKEQAAR